jgi:hypothetical protein
LSAVAAALVSRLQDLDARLQTHQDRLEDSCQRRLILANRDLDRNGNGLRQGLRKHLRIHESRFDGLEDRVRRSIRNRLSSEENALMNQMVRLKERTMRILAGKNQTLNQSLLALSRGADLRLSGTGKDIDFQARRWNQMPRLVEQRLAKVEEFQRYLQAIRPERMDLWQRLKGPDAQERDFRFSIADRDREGDNRLHVKSSMSFDDPGYHDRSGISVKVSPAKGDRKRQIPVVGARASITAIDRQPLNLEA